jgi:hypothetical protein
VNVSRSGARRAYHRESLDRRRSRVRRGRRLVLVASRAARSRRDDARGRVVIGYTDRAAARRRRVHGPVGVVHERGRIADLVWLGRGGGAARIVVHVRRQLPVRAGHLRSYGGT